MNNYTIACIVLVSLITATCIWLLVLLVLQSREDKHNNNNITTSGDEIIILPDDAQNIPEEYRSAMIRAPDFKEDLTRSSSATILYIHPLKETIVNSKVKLECRLPYMDIGYNGSHNVIRLDYGKCKNVQIPTDCVPFFNSKFVCWLKNSSTETNQIVFHSIISNDFVVSCSDGIQQILFLLLEDVILAVDVHGQVVAVVPDTINFDREVYNSSTIGLNHRTCGKILLDAKIFNETVMCMLYEDRYLMFINYNLQLDIEVRAHRIILPHLLLQCGPEQIHFLLYDQNFQISNNDPYIPVSGQTRTHDDGYGNLVITEEDGRCQILGHNQSMFIPFKGSTVLFVTRIESVMILVVRTFNHDIFTVDMDIEKRTINAITPRPDLKGALFVSENFIGLRDRVILLPSPWSEVYVSRSSM